VYINGIVQRCLFLCLKGGVVFSVESIGNLLDKHVKERNIIIEDAVMRRGFVMLPVLLLEDSRLSAGAKVAYGVLLKYAWSNDYCFPGQDKMANDLKVSSRIVIKWLAELKETGYISWKRRGLGKTNVYTIHRIRENVDNHEALSS
jgi:hypothetical protein